MFKYNLFVFALATLAVCVAAVPAVDYVCKPQNEGSDAQFYPHESDCNKFYECANGDVIEMDCPAGLHWNAEINVCDFPANAACELETASLLLVAPAVEYVCNAQNEGSDAQFYPHESDCNKFYECANGDVIEMDCPAGLHWNAEINVCDFPANAACELETASLLLVAPAVEYVCNAQNEGSDAQFYPHESDCNKFYECANGDVIEMDCPAGLHWNAEINVCDFPANAACELETASLLLVAPAVDYVCDAQNEGSDAQFYPHETDCNKFYECANGDVIEMDCPAGLHWNAEINVCDFPANAACELEDEETV